MNEFSKLTNMERSNTILKAFMLIGLPVVIQNLAEFGFGLIDGLMLAGLSKGAFVGVSIVNSIFMIFLLVVSGLNSGLVTLIARATSKSEKKQVVSTGILLGLIVSSIFVSLFLTFAESTMTLFSHSSNVIVSGSKYMEITAWSLPIVAISVAFTTGSRGVYNSKLAAQAISISLLLNTLMNYIGIYILDGGVEAVAYATSVSRILQLILMLTLLKSKNSEIAISRNMFVINKLILIKGLRIALPTMLSEGLIYLSGAIFLYLISSSFETESIAIYQTALNIWLVCRVGMTGLTNTCQVMIARINDNNSIRLLYDAFLKLSIVIGALSGCLLLIIAYTIYRLQVWSPNLIVIAFVFSVVNILYATNSLKYRGLLRALGDTFIPLVNDSISIYVMLGVVLYLRDTMSFVFVIGGYYLGIEILRLMFLQRRILIRLKSEKVGRLECNNA